MCTSNLINWCAIPSLSSIYPSTRVAVRVPACLRPYNAASRLRRTPRNRPKTRGSARAAVNCRWWSSYISLPTATYCRAPEHAPPAARGSLQRRARWSLYVHCSPTHHPPPLACSHDLAMNREMWALLQSACVKRCTLRLEELLEQISAERLAQVRDTVRRRPRPRCLAARRNTCPPRPIGSALSSHLFHGLANSHTRSTWFTYLEA